MTIRDRIKAFRRVPARDLVPHPKNWRVHPQAQQDALQALLAELGYCDAVIARDVPDGARRRRASRVSQRWCTLQVNRTCST